MDVLWSAAIGPRIFCCHRRSSCPPPSSTGADIILLAQPFNPPSTLNLHAPTSHPSLLQIPMSTDLPFFVCRTSSALSEGGRPEDKDATKELEIEVLGAIGAHAKEGNGAVEQGLEDVFAEQPLPSAPACPNKFTLHRLRRAKSTPPQHHQAIILAQQGFHFLLLVGSDR